MTTVNQILRKKGTDVCAVAPEATVFEALTFMAEMNVGAVLVMDSGRLEGIFSERDYARKVILQGRSSKETPVREIMTERVVCVRPDQTAEECMALMTEKRVRHLPVVENDRIIGVISIGDVVKSIIYQQQFVIEQLENYITGAR